MRRSDMRNRRVALAAVLAFAVAAVGVAVVVARSGDDGPLDPLPVRATGNGSPETGAQSEPASAVTYRVQATLPDVPDAVMAFRLADPDPDHRKRLADAVGADRVQVADAPGSPWYVGAGPGTSVASSGSGAPGTQPRPADLPHRDDVLRRAHQLFVSLGVHGEVEVVEGPATVDASLSPRVHGEPTIGYEHRLSFGAKGEIVAGQGYLGRPTQLGHYPIVDAAEGVERLQKGFIVGPRDLVGRPEPAPQELAITGVELGLQLVEGYLVPAYLFQVDGRPGPAVVAVVERLLGKAGGKAPRPVPVTEPELPDGAESCGASAGGLAVDPGDGEPTEPANEPLTVQVCGPATAAVGEEVAFEATVADPDAEVIESGCGGPQVAFGDEEGVMRADCMPACAAPLKEGRPGRLQRTFRHAYAKPGTYTATFSFRSAFCTKGSSHGEGEHTIVVR